MFQGQEYLDDILYSSLFFILLICLICFQMERDEQGTSFQSSKVSATALDLCTPAPKLPLPKQFHFWFEAGTVSHQVARHIWCPQCLQSPNSRGWPVRSWPPSRCLACTLATRFPWFLLIALLRPVFFLGSLSLWWFFLGFLVKMRFISGNSHGFRRWHHDLESDSESEEMEDKTDRHRSGWFSVPIFEIPICKSHTKYVGLEFCCKTDHFLTQWLKHFLLDAMLSILLVKVRLRPLKVGLVGDDSDGFGVKHIGNWLVTVTRMGRVFSKSRVPKPAPEARPAGDWLASTLVRIDLPEWPSNVLVPLCPSSSGLLCRIRSITKGNPPLTFVALRRFKQ